MELIENELRQIKLEVKEILKRDISDEQAFEFLSEELFCLKERNGYNPLFDIEMSITNGPNDGGVDFVYYDEESSKVILGQCKYTKNLKLNDIITELNKMSTTVENFKISNTGIYNEKLRAELQNALDRLPDGDEGNVEYNIYTISDYDETSIMNKIEAEHNTYSKEMVNVYGKDEFITKIKEKVEKLNTIEEEFTINIDQANNYLTYSNSSADGIMVNMSSNSLIKMFNKYKDEGLLDMNIRKYVKNKMVDDGIKRTLDKDRSNFWFFNNGIIIACDDCYVDGNTVKIRGFSIVNGGQTTNRIGNYKGSNHEEFFIPCKIICINNKNKNLFSKVAETTNSQKPIYPRDLKANSPEMKMLQSWLDKENIYLEIKRGEKKKNKKYKIKNDELGQLILSFVYQQPGTARSGKKTIFDNNNYYNKLYKQNYEKDINKKKFITDLIKLNQEYIYVEEKLKNDTAKYPTKLNNEQKIILKNAKYIFISLFGISYFLENGDIDLNDIISDPEIVTTQDFIYGKFINNYRKDDFEEKITALIVQIIYCLEEIYNRQLSTGSITSVSNLFKTDKKYRELIVRHTLQNLNMPYHKGQFDSCIEIFKR
ncbi:AIPR family protein [Faecalibacillus intestinalis]|uniref:AIPR family protein n=1 Tax=Faecalibacillus intestinalis TaxID=1982626 RepID=UPI003523037C